MSILTDNEKEILAKFRKEHGADMVGCLRCHGQFVVYRGCTLPERTRATQTAEKTDKATANDQLARACTVYPETVEERAQMFNRYPFLLENISQLIQKISGGDIEVLGND